MNEFTKQQIDLQNEMAALSGCRAQLRDLWLKNSSAELQDAMSAILDRLKAAEQELDAAIQARDLDEDLHHKEDVPIVRLRLKV